MWEIVKLKEVCSFTRGLTYSKKDEAEHSKNAVLRATNIDLSSYTITYDDMRYISDEVDVKIEKRAKRDDLLICTASGSKAHLGKVALVKDDLGMAFGGFMAAIRPNDDCLSEFLFAVMISVDFKKHLGRLNDGANINNLKFSQIEDYEFPLPPIPEQQRIVAILDQAFAEIEKARANAEQNLKNARELFDSYFNNLLLDICSQAPSQTLNCICELIVDCEHKTAPVQDEGYPSIRTPNIGRGNLILDKVRRVSQETYHLWTRRAVPEGGDLILAREAPAGNIGVVPNGEQVCLGQRTVLIRPQKADIDSHYLAFFLLHPIMQSRLLAHSTGATVQHINMKDIRNLPVANFPSMSYQLASVKKLLDAQAQSQVLENVYQRKLKSLDELKKSLLQKAFTGELTKSKGMAA